MRRALSGRTDSCVRNLGFLRLNLARFALAACMLAGLMTASGLAQQFASLPTSGRASESYGPAKPTEAWINFCRRHGNECGVNGNEPETVALTPKVWALITATNRKVNRQIKPATDAEHWGVVDRWDFPDDGKGDCEDYQLLKRKLLVEAGLPRRAMRMTVVIDEEGQGHAVVMVRTDRGDFVLDNKRDAVLTWDQTPYTYIKREGQAGAEWVSLGGIASPTATANR
jgi:predicted transglutaminase-like cysteine proteinase